MCTAKEQHSSSSQVTGALIKYFELCCCLTAREVLDRLLCGGLTAREVLGKLSGDPKADK